MQYYTDEVNGYTMVPVTEALCSLATVTVTSSRARVHRSLPAVSV